MFDTLADVPPTVVALSLVSTALLGVAFAAQPSPPPRADALAATVDGVAAADAPSVATRRVDADAVRVSTRAVAVREGATTTRSRFAYSEHGVVPVRRGTALWRVLRGVPPDDAFDGPLAFARAAVDARQRDHAWRHDPGRLTVRRVTWRGVDVTLVGA
ncbi:DUF7283 family protein [Halobacterium yunchengense]|uniref:DUF7283 family protein n=1 Tax=Halobacterium yunchengense TaxID=3108497 RepID=UPI003008945C